MKKIILLILLSIFMFSCVDDSWKQELEEIKAELSNQKKLIEALQQNASITNIEQLDGKYTIHFSDGQSITLTNGRTPIITIGENGNWYIDGVDTGNKSQGENGENGVDGINGTTPTIEIGKNGNWFINNIDTGVKAEGIDGKDSPILISIVDTGGFLNFYFSDSSIITCTKETINFTSDRWNGKVRAKETIYLNENYIRKNTFLSCNITFESFQPILIGRGQNLYAGYYIEMNNDSLYIHKFAQEDLIVERIKHNLKINNKLNIFIDYADTSRAKLTIYTENQKFYKEIQWWAGGAPFIKNNGIESISASLNFQAKDAKCPIWIFGDSYINWTTSTRWPYYIYKSGYTNWLADHLPGGSSKRFINCFKNDLNYGNPTYAIWCLGMNDGSDKNNTVDEKWLESIKEFITVCESKGIIPILSTIPSVPNRNNKLKSQWVRESGYRYIDFSRSVSTDDSNIWFEGMLSSDNIHPTSLGAEAMSIQVLVDFPEITINK